MQRFSAALFFQVQSGVRTQYGSSCRGRLNTSGKRSGVGAAPEALVYTSCSFGASVHLLDIGTRRLNCAVNGHWKKIRERARGVPPVCPCGVLSEKFPYLNT